MNIESTQPAEDTRRTARVSRRGRLADRLAGGLDRRGMSAEALAERTKVPRSTIDSFLEEPISAVLPERVYLRGQLVVLARELGLDGAELRRLFDEQYPAAPAREASPSTSRFSPASITLVAGMGCIALVAVVLAFATSL
jgi:cytoskeletal protein RodZ